jgi:Tfp pilus assembly protein PilX
MGTSMRNQRGFTLIAALMVTILLSGVAVGILYLTNGELAMGRNDLETNQAYYAAEAQMENLAAQLDILYQTNSQPKTSDVEALYTNTATWANNISGSPITDIAYTYPAPPPGWIGGMITWPGTNSVTGASCATVPNNCATTAVVQAGENAGMFADIVPYTLNVTATRQNALNATGTGGASASLTRQIEVALIPAFEYGIFCNGDCDYFAGPAFNFGGRVHTNGSLFLASGDTLTFTDKVSAYNQIVLDQLENGHSTSSGYGGTVYIPTATNGCPAAPGAGPAANCKSLNAQGGSWSGGFPTPPAPAIAGPNDAGAALPFKGVTNYFGGFIENGVTGAKNLKLPFEQSSPFVGPIDLIRRPQLVGANADSQELLNSRLYEQANIRILIADTLADLHPERGAAALDKQDVEIMLPTDSYGTNTLAGAGTTTSTPAYLNGVQLNYTGAPASTYMYFASANPTAFPKAGWVAPGNPAGGKYTWTAWPLLGQVTTSPATGAAPAPAGVGVWLRVEYFNGTIWVGVTQEWLGFGFGRPYDVPPTAPWGSAGGQCAFYGGATATNYARAAYPGGQCYNPISPAILILQQLRQEETAVTNGYEADTTDSTHTAFNWIPINFYDSREGEPREDGSNARTTNTEPHTGSANAVYTPCSPVGVMNAVELDVGNLWLWLQKAAPYAGGSGGLVSQTNMNGVNNNGWILYFSDHRGMRGDPHAPYNTFYNNMAGSSGLEDTINSSSSTGAPDNSLEPTGYYTFSPEDVNGDGFLDNQGAAYIGAGFADGAGNPFTTSSTEKMNQMYYPMPAQAPATKTNQLNCNSYVTQSSGTSLPAVYDFGNATAGYIISGSPQNNMVTGPRHVLRLVDGGMNGTISYLPHPNALGATGNGFTVASEEPVYIYGDYNTGKTDPLWGSPANYSGALHSATAVIADSVTLLSNPPSGATTPADQGWTDVESFLYPGDMNNRPDNQGYYRLAIAAGKSIPFPQPTGYTAAQDFGTDGGMHNFLRYLEKRSNVSYSGSLVSMYYSQYATGTFKCCTKVYGAPTRNYFFDTQFLNPNNLPPGTPMFQDVISLSYHQSFTPQ